MILSVIFNQYRGNKFIDVFIHWLRLSNLKIIVNRMIPVRLLKNSLPKNIKK